MPRGGPAVRPEEIRFAFAGYGEAAPAGLRDRLYLDVGGDVRPGVLDHHHAEHSSACTTDLVLRHPELVLGAVDPTREERAPFTVVLHERPDLDCVASAFLAVACLTRGQFPPGSEALAGYVARVDEGSLGLSLANLFSLYSAYVRLTDRTAGAAGAAAWETWVRGGLEVVGYVLEQAGRAGRAVEDVDAFGSPGLFGEEDHEAVRADVRRYEAKLGDPATHARTARLRLPGSAGGVVEAEALLVRDVQNDGDPAACLFFKDWARSDARRGGNGRGFVALSVFMSESPRQKRRCILSVTPGSGATLRGLGALLDEAEGGRRRELHDVDDRVTDPATGAALPPRPGYANADPWYDGRGHGYTIVDSPRSGTRLSADEIEALFLDFGGASASPLSPR
jgi:hypothetical protein